jgi:sulfur carrier protein
VKTTASPQTLALTLNGEALRFYQGSVADLIASRGLAGKRIAVERNGAIVPRSAHAGTQLVDGDSIEIVVAVGGG